MRDSNWTCPVSNYWYQVLHICNIAVSIVLFIPRWMNSQLWKWMYWMLPATHKSEKSTSTRVVISVVLDDYEAVAYLYYIAVKYSFSSAEPTKLSSLSGVIAHQSISTFLTQLRLIHFRCAQASRKSRLVLKYRFACLCGLSAGTVECCIQ